MLPINFVKCLQFLIWEYACPANALGKMSSVVYRMPCSCGQVYTGKTKQRLETRLREHRDACKRGNMEKSAVADHAWENHHPINWKETSVFDRPGGQGELLLK